jgi:hypothetical protein
MPKLWEKVLASDLQKREGKPIKISTIIEMVATIAVSSLRLGKHSESVFGFCTDNSEERYVIIMETIWRSQFSYPMLKLIWQLVKQRSQRYRERCGMNGANKHTTEL